MEPRNPAERGHAEGGAAEHAKTQADPYAMPEPAFPIDEVARVPAPGLALPGRYSFAPGDSAVVFLDSPDDSLTRELFALDLESGTRRPVVDAGDKGVTEEGLSIEEKLRRERSRERGLGITTYAWSKEGDTLLVPIRGSIAVQRGLDGELVTLVERGEHPAIDPRLSRDGRHVAYVMDDELYVVATQGGPSTQITSGARGTGRSHGLAEYIAQEEMDRSHGFWWSPDATRIAYTEVDETHIPAYRIVHQGKDQVGEGAQEDHGYPFAGQENARVRLGVVGRGGGRTVWMDLPTDEERYLARVDWGHDGMLWAQLQNRAQTRLELVRFDPATGARSPVLEETSDVWINLHHAFRTLDPAHAGVAYPEGAFLWASERSGFRHLYLHGAGGELLRPLTEGEWMVDAVVGVDEAGGRVFFTATLDGPTERNLYVVPLAGGTPRRLTPEAGTHDVVLSRDFTRFIDTHHALGQPPRVRLRSAAGGEVLRELHASDDPRVEALGLEPPRIVTLEARDGLKLYAAIYDPPEDAPRPAPILVSVYGGPHAQRVTDGWGLTVDMRAQYLRSLGFAVIKLDNRGSARRGLAFEGAIRHDMGNLELRDQADGVAWLAAQGIGDPARVGIYGWSYGGYMSAMALARAPETFHVGVAGAPVTHWDGYDTHYTERYMGTPQDNPEGYERSAVMSHVQGLRGELLLVHGLIDENVHFRHTARLINALIEARKPYELLLFPDERHVPRGEAGRIYMEERVRDFLATHLQPGR